MLWQVIIVIITIIIKKGWQCKKKEIKKKFINIK